MRVPRQGNPTKKKAAHRPPSNSIHEVKAAWVSASTVDEHVPGALSAPRRSGFEGVAMR